MDNNGDYQSGMNFNYFSSSIDVTPSPSYSWSSSYQSASYQSDSYQSSSYQSGSYDSGSYLSSSYQSDSYQSGSYWSGSYQSCSYLYGNVLPDYFISHGYSCFVYGYSSYSSYYDSYGNTPAPNSYSYSGYPSSYGSGGSYWSNSDYSSNIGSYSSIDDPFQWPYYGGVPSSQEPIFKNNSESQGGYDEYEIYEDIIHSVYGKIFQKSKLLT